MNSKGSIISPIHSRFLKNVKPWRQTWPNGKKWWFYGAIGLLSGCFGQVDNTAQTPVTETETHSVAAQAEIVQAQNTRSRSINRLLAQGQSALNRDQLTTPLHDNAVDRFRAILLIEPGNQQALAGLERVVRRYCQLAQSAIGGGRFSSAEQYIAKAKSVVDGLSIIEQTEARLVEARRRVAEVVEAEPVVVSGVQQSNEIKLPRKALSQRSDMLVEALGQLAERVKNGDLYVLIIARNDSEGRWVYQQMRNAVPGYRLRGNIQIGRVPKIQLEAPL